MIEQIVNFVFGITVVGLIVGGVVVLGLRAIANAIRKEDEPT